NWEILKPRAIPNEGLWPMERCNHASAILNGDSTSPTLVVIGGQDNNNELVNECLLFDSITTGQYSCRKIPLPESVTGRYSHSLTAVTMSPHCVWLVTVGGYEELEWEDVGGGKEEPWNIFITDTNRLIMIIELDKLDCLSDVQVAERKLFLIQGDKPQLMNWEKYGLRIGVQKESLLSSETVEAAMVALVGGEFEFPPNTVLVSAVYAVSLSKPLLKRLILEIQHCVDLTGRPALSRHLKFAIAPVSTPSLPYQFSLVEGGEFSSNSWYGSIQRKEFCLVCILGLIMVTMTSIGGQNGHEGGGDGGGGGQSQQQQGAAGQQQPAVGGGGALAPVSQPGTGQSAAVQQGGQPAPVQREGGQPAPVQQEGGQPAPVRQEGGQPAATVQQEGGQPAMVQQEGGQPAPVQLEGGQIVIEGNEGDRGQEAQQDPSQEGTAIATLCTESSSNYANNLVVTSVLKKMKYAGIIYYEEKGLEDLVTFTAAKDLNALVE
uniref:Uncharacterized protein n=1 Tax=Amphimedon queenslandica TaxID=400682 RepID=A0A1X7T515_AMPQE